jgi:hypothetical protein
LSVLTVLHFLFKTKLYSTCARREKQMGGRSRLVHATFLFANCTVDASKRTCGRAGSHSGNGRTEDGEL